MFITLTRNGKPEIVNTDKIARVKESYARNSNFHSSVCFDEKNMEKTYAWVDYDQTPAQIKSMIKKD